LPRPIPEFQDPEHPLLGIQVDWASRFEKKLAYPGSYLPYLFLVMELEALPLHLQTTISPFQDVDKVGRTRSSTPSSSFAGVAVPYGFGDPLELEAIEAGRGGASVSDPPNRSSSPSSDIATICIYIYLYIYCIYV